jgi:hypothetical protein
VAVAGPQEVACLDAVLDAECSSALPLPSRLCILSAVDYALVQKSMTRPEVTALERAFACGRGLTPADARFVADDAFGLLARNLSLEDALFLQLSLGTEGIEVEVVPESALPRAADAELFSYLECQDGRLVLFNALEQIFETECDAVSILCAGYDQREVKIELFAGPEPRRFSGTMDRMLWEHMPQFADPSEPDNIGEQYRNLVRHLVRACPNALVNRAAAVLAQEELTGDVTEQISYPRPTAYMEELTWLLWKTQGVASE